MSEEMKDVFLAKLDELDRRLTKIENQYKKEKTTDFLISESSKTIRTRKCIGCHGLMEYSYLFNEWRCHDCNSYIDERGFETIMR